MAVSISVYANVESLLSTVLGPPIKGLAINPWGMWTSLRVSPPRYHFEIKATLDLQKLATIPIKWACIVQIRLFQVVL